MVLFLRRVNQPTHIMHRSSLFKIKIDFEKSRGSYLYDKNTDAVFLDFFGQYASLPLGYNHPVFKGESFCNEYMRIAGVKVTNCEIISDEAQEFLKEFSEHPAMSAFTHFHFCCTGALAIESAIKTAIDHKGSLQPVIVSLKESFHGINGYGGFLTDRFYPVSSRLEGFPELGWQKLHNPKIIYREDGGLDEAATKKGLTRFIDEFEKCVAQCGENNIAALLIEPIQATYGDNYFPKEFFTAARILCDKYNICLIFDEVQTGFGGTGSIWYFEQTGIIPDIVVFGKKVQVSGIMVQSRVGRIFNTPVRLEVTWDGTLSDMVRGKYVLRTYQAEEILKNVSMRSKELTEGLMKLPIKNLRNAGLLFAFDLPSASARDALFRALIKERFLSNKTRELTIRLRPQLGVSKEEIQDALARIGRALSSVGIS